MDQKKAEEPEVPQQSLIDHLTELRFRLIRSFWAIGAGMVVAYNFSDQIFDFIRAPIQPYLAQAGLVFTAPTDKFIAHLKVSIFAGVLCTAPIWLYQIWRFVAPALYSKEKKYTLAFLVSGTALFLGGVAFSYYGVMPMALKYLLGFGGTQDQPMITIDQYLSFFLTMNLMFGLVFELPLIIVILGMLDIVSARFLKEKRRYALVGLSVVAAIFTPGPDLLSMILMFVPLAFFYEISILVVALFERKRTTTSQTAD